MSDDLKRRRIVFLRHVGERVEVKREYIAKLPASEATVIDIKRTRAVVEFPDAPMRRVMAGLLDLDGKLVPEQWTVPLDWLLLPGIRPAATAAICRGVNVGPLDHYRQIWCCDFEFTAPAGERPDPLCLVAREYRSGRTLRLWRDDLRRLLDPPFSINPDSLFVAYYASAELSCFKALRWPMPVRILDLFAEFRCLTNGLCTACGSSLLGALAHYGIDGIDSAEKEDMRALAMRGGEYSEVERKALLDYCESDVIALAKLLPAMLPQIDLPRALLRGRYMAAAAQMEYCGTPIDISTLQQLRQHWGSIKSRLIVEIDRSYNVFVPHTIDANSRLGQAIYKTAAEYDCHPLHLAAAVEDVYQRYVETYKPLLFAELAARKATGLTTKRIQLWEDSGFDHSRYPGLDVKARELASDLPELGIGLGYDDDDGRDHAAALWDRLREPTESIKPNWHPDIIGEAAGLVAGMIDPPAGAQLGFSAARFADWLIKNSIPWPRLESGALDLSDNTFRQMARTYTAVAPLRELRHTLGEMRLFDDLAVGSDGRNRCLLSAFRSITGRNQPSNARFIFGPSTWLRGLIQPAPGRALAYIDWSQQEFGIAAALSGDKAMQAAYSSGDPYLTFAKQAGAVPADATKESHKAERELFKVCALATQYGMGPQSLARSLDQPECLARQLLQLHRQTYPAFWRWSEGAINHAMLRGWLWTVFGWRVHVGSKANPRSLGNFPCQANGAEMLRLACCLATEAGIEVCAPVHDAILIEADERLIEASVEITQDKMIEASRIVLSGFELRSDAKIVRHPDRYSDPRGERMWETVTRLLGEAQERCEVAERLHIEADF